MKNLKYIWLLCLALTAVCFVSCDDDDNQDSKPIVISKIYLEDYKSAVPDREVQFARLGQLIRIEGNGFLGIKRVYINGYETFFNVAYVADNSMLITVDSKTPVVDAPDDVRNKIRLVKSGAELEYTFEIRSAAPSISRISNTLPQAQEKVTVYGTGLHETSKVTLPDGTEITANIESDEDGEWYSFTMPSGITASGSITSEGANGIAVTPAYFNDSNCMILNFDGKGAQGSWNWSETGSMISADDLVNDPDDSGRGKCLQIVPDRLLAGNGVAAGKPRVTECWTVGAGEDETVDWSYMYSHIPATTALTDVAFQFDINVPDAWIGTGHIQICLFNNFNYGGIGSDDDGQRTAFYVPYIQDGAVVPFTTTGWQTVTIPFSEFGYYKKQLEEGTTTPTFQTVVDDRLAATYQNFGVGFVNTDFTYGGVSITSTLFKTKIYLDNLRVVPCASVTVSDFDDEE